MTAMNNERNPHSVLLPIGTQAATITLPFVWISRKFRILTAQLINGATLAADASNHVLIQIRRGAEIVAEWSTETGEDGALTANTGSTMRILDPVQLGGSQLTVVVTATGTVTTTNLLLQLNGFYV